MDSDNDIINKLRMDVVRLESKFEISEKAVEYARDALNIRLESMNHFRADLKDQQKNFVTRSELFGFLATASVIVIALITLIVRMVK